MSLSTNGPFRQSDWYWFPRIVVRRGYILLKVFNLFWSVYW